jgi:hypothetical protein
MPTKHRPNLIHNLFYDKDGNLVLGQAPNLPAYIAFAAWILKTWLPAGWPHILANLIYFSAAMIWAILEIGWGVNWFRRLLGATIMVVLIVTWWPV